MVIDRIVIKNFRGFINKEFIFKDCPVVLLSAANGLGKTTVIDAIEWCLTGNIGRLKNAYDNRSSNETDRKMNVDGILKNRNAGVNDEISVCLYLNDGQKVTTLCRRQKNDELNPDLSDFLLDGDEKEANEFYRNFVGDSFYNYHFCDVQKSFYIQNSKRKDLRVFFDEFLTNFDDQKATAYNLELFSKDVRRHLKDMNNELTGLERELSKLESRRNTVIEKDKPFVYPKTSFYSDEIIDISSLNDDDLRKQKAELYNCGYIEAKNALDLLVNNEKLAWQQAKLKEIAQYWEKKKDSIMKAKAYGVYNNSKTIDVLEEKLAKLKNLSISKERIFRVGDSLISLGIKGFSVSEFEVDKKTVCDYEAMITNHKSEIELLSHNNRILRLMSNLSANKKLIIGYREDALNQGKNPRCPICGSEEFATIRESLILKEADDYIRINGEVVENKESQIEIYRAEIDDLCDKYIVCFTKIVDNEIKYLEKYIEELSVLFDDVQMFFSDVNLLKNEGLDIDMERINLEYLDEIIRKNENGILEENKKRELVEYYKRILDVIGCEYNNDTVQQTYAKVQTLISTKQVVSDFSCNDLVGKIIAIDSILANNELTSLNRDINDCKDRLSALSQKKKKYDYLAKAAENRSTEIKNLIEDLSRAEYEIVGPTLNKYYNKLSRINYDDKIIIVPEKGGVSLVDNQNMQLVNVLSNGQISVFVLALFFAGIKAREYDNKLKLYFIDDLTSCMDGVNMLAFVDLLKYQLDSKQVMDQLFFATCDNRISELIKYKLNGRGIDYYELSEADFI